MTKMKIAILVICALFLVSSCKQPSGDNSTNSPTNSTVYPEFSPIGGFYKSGQSVSITCQGSGNIYYTTDGTTPDDTSTLYTGPVILDAACVIRALSVNTDGSKHYAMTAFDFDLDRSTDYNGTAAASPKWQDQIIYFLMTDRFYNGNSSNDNDGDSFDETVAYSGQAETGYNGGDFAGIQAKLQYIKNLGATTVWLTPPIKNQITDGNYHGYHGYWATDFTETDPHFGTLAEYQSLVSAAHDNGMYVVQDIVVNHTGDYQKIATPGVYVTNGTIVTDSFSLNTDSKNIGQNPGTAPTQIPWNMNNPNNLTADEFVHSSFYNFNPAISDFNNPAQQYVYQESDLDDIKTTDPVVQNLLRGYFRYWIDKVGLDGYRIDTVKYVEPAFFEGFINSTAADNKGVREYAKEKGKDDFFDFGECWDTNETVISSYTKDPDSSAKRIDGAIYFSLNSAIRNCLSAGTATYEIANVLNRRYAVLKGYDDPNRLVTFIDNHDMDRMIKLASPELVKAAYSIIMTIPGIPQIYYGTEQGYTTRRAAMFAGGYDCTADAFDETGEWYTFFKDLIALRKNNELFRYNRVKVLKSTTTSGGILSYAVIGRDTNDSAALPEAVGNRALVVINNSNVEQVFNTTQNIFAAGDVFTLQSPSTAGFPSSITIDSDKRVSIIVPPSGYGIYLLSEVGSTSGTSPASVTISSSYPDVVTANEITINGTASDAGTVYAVLNGDYTNAQQYTLSESGAFSLTYDVSTLSSDAYTLELVLKTAVPDYAYSAQVAFTLLRPYVECLTITDPSGDDTGPAGYSYTMPTTPIQPFDGQMDITGVVVKTSGSNICLEVSTRRMSRGWSPTTNMYDHVMFSIFLAKPGSTSGSTIHPKQNYTLPGGFAWDYMLKAEGWSSGFYSSAGATAAVNGTSVTPAPTSEVDWSVTSATTYQPGLIKFYIKGASLGNPTSLSGWKIYINTYDYDMGDLRGMAVAPSGWKFGGGDISTDPLVIDETSIMTIP